VIEGKKRSSAVVGIWVVNKNKIGIVGRAMKGRCQLAPQEKRRRGFSRILGFCLCP